MLYIMKCINTIVEYVYDSYKNKNILSNKTKEDIMNDILYYSSKIYNYSTLQDKIYYSFIKHLENKVNEKNTIMYTIVGYIIYF